MNHSHSGNKLAPKPYDFVPFARQVKREPVPGHEKLELNRHFSGRLAYRLKALTPIFVSDGSYALGNDVGFPEERVIRPFCRIAGVPTIPGSSIKGVVRSIAEAISPSCLTVIRLSGSQFPQGVKISQRSNCTPTDSCPACSIFGRMGQLGKAYFTDARLLDQGKLQLFRLSPLFAPRAFKAPPFYLDKNGKFKGLKFYYHSQPAEDRHQPPVEVIAEGGEVQGQVDFENLTPAQLGLLFFALGMDGTIALKLGGGKPLGLGSLQLVAAELALLGPDHYTKPEVDELVYAGEKLSNFVGQQIDAALNSKLLLTTQVLALADILTFKRNRHAPEGAY